MKLLLNAGSQMPASNKRQGGGGFWCPCSTVINGSLQ